jgi:hypothetical protein
LSQARRQPTEVAEACAAVRADPGLIGSWLHVFDLHERVGQHGADQFVRADRALICGGPLSPALA